MNSLSCLKIIYEIKGYCIFMNYYAFKMRFSKKWTKHNRDFLKTFHSDRAMQTKGIFLKNRLILWINTYVVSVNPITHGLFDMAAVPLIHLSEASPHDM